MTVPSPALTQLCIWGTSSPCAPGCPRRQPHRCWEPGCFRANCLLPRPTPAGTSKGYVLCPVTRPQPHPELLLGPGNGKCVFFLNPEHIFSFCQNGGARAARTNPRSFGLSTSPQPASSAARWPRWLPAAAGCSLGPWEGRMAKGSPQMVLAICFLVIQPVNAERVLHF